jgi:hypothetical protein
MTDERLEADERISPDDEPELAEALRAAHAPRSLDPARSELLVEQALEDPLRAPTEEEIRESARLREALESGGDHPDVRLARALATALAPPEQHDPARFAQLASRAIESRQRAAAGGNVIHVVFGVAAGVVALAAAIAIVVRPSSDAAPEPVLRVSRSTAPMFREPFDTRRTSARVDRIALARERDLRANRYALWGVSR